MECKPDVSLRVFYGKDTRKQNDVVFELYGSVVKITWCLDKWRST